MTNSADKRVKTLAILQSNYIPWKGYFDIVNTVDEFILFDDVQYTKNDWRNRNKIKTPHGLLWLTIPVATTGKFMQKIKDVVVQNPIWVEKHWKSIVQNYSKAAYFKTHRDFFQELYLQCHERFLSQINYRFLTAICNFLGIKTKISWSMEYELLSEKTERLVHLCKQAGATRYLTGPSAKAYLREDMFKSAGIEITYMDYSGYPQYPQLFAPFEHGVSIIDLILNTGAQASKYMKTKILQ